MQFLIPGWKPFLVEILALQNAFKHFRKLELRLETKPYSRTDITLSIRELRIGSKFTH